MTQSYGFFCPVCWIRFRPSSCKKGKLPCGCGTKKKDAFYLYRKNYGKGRSEIRIDYKGKQFEASIPARNITEGIRKIRTFLSESNITTQVDLWQRALTNIILLESHTEYTGWKARCTQCEHQQANGLYLIYLRCKLGKKLSVACKEWKRRRP